MQVLLEDLPTVGDVTVTRGEAPAGFSDGFTWTITFETQVEDLELLYVDGNSTAVPIVGDYASLSVVEMRRGKSPALELDIKGLDYGQTYFSRVSARNSAGFGETTLGDASTSLRGSNNDGLGIAPLTTRAQTAPGAPRVAAVDAVSASELQVVLDAPLGASSADIQGYKVRCAVFRVSFASSYPLGHKEIG